MTLEISSCFTKIVMSKDSHETLKPCEIFLSMLKT